MKIISILLVITTLFFSCNSKNKDSVSYGKQTSQAELNSQHPGKILMDTNCYVCHNATTSQDERLYPNDKALGYNINEVRGIWSLTFDK